MVLQYAWSQVSSSRSFCTQKLIVMIILKKWEELVFRQIIIIEEKAIQDSIYSREKVLIKPSSRPVLCIDKDYPCRKVAVVMHFIPFLSYSFWASRRQIKIECRCTFVVPEVAIFAQLCCYVPVPQLLLCACPLVFVTLHGRQKYIQWIYISLYIIILLILADGDRDRDG